MTPARSATGTTPPPPSPGASVEEHVLEVAPVGLEAHQAEPEVGRGVADHVVHGDPGRRGLHGDRRSRAGDR